MEFLDDRPPDRPGVLALDDDRPSRPIDDLLHDDVPPLVGRPLCLADVFVAEVPEDVLDQVFELESREVVQYSHPNVIGQHLAISKYVADDSDEVATTGALLLLYVPQGVRDDTSVSGYR